MKAKFRNELMAALVGTFSADQLHEIDKALVSVLNDYDLNVAVKDLAIMQPIPNCLNVYLASRKLEGLSEKTIELYQGYLSKFFLVVNKPIEQIKTNDVRLYLYEIENSKRMSNRSLDKVRGVIATFFKWACAEGYLPYDICANIKPIKYVAKEREPLDEYELEAVRSACSTLRDKALIEFLYSTGCRVSEVANLKKKDIDFSTGTATVFGKGSKYRNVPLNPKSIIALKKYFESRVDENESAFVRARVPYNSLSKNSLEYIVKDIGIKAELGRPLFPHLIRHTTATIGLQRGMNVTEIQLMLGHTNIETTMIYAKQDESAMRMAHSRCIV